MSRSLDIPALLWSGLTTQKILTRINHSQMIQKGNEIMPSSQAARTVRNSRLERVFAPSISSNLSYTLPCFEMVDHFLLKIDPIAADESKSVCSRRLLLSASLIVSLGKTPFLDWEWQGISFVEYPLAADSLTEGLSFSAAARADVVFSDTEVEEREDFNKLLLKLASWLD